MAQRLRAAHDVPIEVRIRATRLIAQSFGAQHDRISAARDVESSAHDAAADEEHYRDLVLKCALNCRNNAINASCYTARMPDDVLIRGTILEQIRNTEEERKKVFERMLQEKFASIDSEAYKSSLKCRRCNSVDVSWEQKQTRSADEGMTVYCVCAKCGNKWTMR